jgi:hypothetical protein
MPDGRPFSQKILPFFFFKAIVWQRETVEAKKQAGLFLSF